MRGTRSGEDGKDERRKAATALAVWLRAPGPEPEASTARAVRPGPTIEAVAMKARYRGMHAHICAHREEPRRAQNCARRRRVLHWHRLGLAEGFEPFNRPPEKATAGSENLLPGPVSFNHPGQQNGTHALRNQRPSRIRVVQTLLPTALQLLRAFLY